MSDGARQRSSSQQPYSTARRRRIQLKYQELPGCPYAAARALAKKKGITAAEAFEQLVNQPKVALPQQR